MKKSTSTTLHDLAARMREMMASVRDEVEQLRAALAATRLALRFQTSAPVPLGDILARIPDVVAQAGARWMDHPDGGRYLLQSGNDPAAHLAAVHQHGDVALPEGLTRDWFGALCAGAPDQAEAVLTALVRRTSFEPGTPAADRPAVLERLGREVTALETQEETLVDQAAADGLDVAHRPDVLERRETAARRARQDAERQAYFEANPRPPQLSPEARAHLNAQLSGAAAPGSGIQELSIGGI